MEFTFDPAEIQRMKEQMTLEKLDIYAGRVHAQLKAEMKFTGPVVHVQLGGIDQTEWNKWRQQNAAV